MASRWWLDGRCAGGGDRRGDHDPPERAPRAPWLGSVAVRVRRLAGGAAVLGCLHRDRVSPITEPRGYPLAPVRGAGRRGFAPIVPRRRAFAECLVARGGAADRGGQRAGGRAPDR